MTDDKIKTIFTIVGGVLGIIAFLWNLLGYMWSYVFSHLQIDLSNEPITINDVKKLKVITTVENKANIAKKIDYAFLLIHPAGENFQKALFEIAKSKGYINNENNKVKLLEFIMQNKEGITSPTINNRFIISELPFFYEDQFQIGNEKVKYSTLINLTELQKNDEYHIRFMIISKHLFNSYLRYRSTVDLFIH